MAVGVGFPFDAGFGGVKTSPAKANAMTSPISKSFILGVFFLDPLADG